MFKIKTALIASAILSICVLSFIGSSYAIEITAIHPYHESEPFVYIYDVQTHNGSNGYHTTVAITDEPYFAVDFYVDSDYQGSVWSLNDETDAIFRFYSLYGSIKGTTRKITAVAYTLDGEYDFDSYTITVWDGVEKYGTSENDVYIWAAIDRHYYDGSSITSIHRGGAYYYNHFGGNVGFFYRFRREVTDPNDNIIIFQPVEGNYPATPGEYTEYPAYSWSVPAGQAGEWSSSAYTMIQADGATATATSTESFDVPAW